MKLIKIGRSIESDFVVENDSTISRNHAEIFIDNENRVFITDLNSSNGTFVNGNRITDSTLLNELDILKLGNTIINWKEFLKEEKNVNEEVISNQENVLEFVNDEYSSTEERSNNFNYLYYTSPFILSLMYVFFKYGINDLFFVFEVLAALFIPFTISYIIYLITKRNYEIILNCMTVLFLVVQFLVF